MVEYIKIYDGVLNPTFCNDLIDKFHKNSSSIQHFPGWPWPHRGLRPEKSDKYIVSTYFCYPTK